MSNLDTIAPEQSTSILVAVVATVSTVLMMMVIAPFLASKKLRTEFPNNLIAWIGFATSIANCGLLIGVPHDFQPTRYEDTAVCGFQSALIFCFGVWALLLVFCYTLGLYQIVVRRQQGRHIAHQTRWIVVVTFLIAFVFNVLIPYAAPVEMDDGESKVFAPQGPWCGPANSVVLIVGFYLPTIIPALLSIFMASRIIIVVFKTTKATEAFSSGKNVAESPRDMSDKNNNSGHKKRSRQRKRQLQRFYARVSLFVIAFCVATVISFFRRLRDAIDGVDDTAANDNEMGTSMAIPILAFIEALVLLSTPAVSRFYTRHFPGVKPLSSTTEGSSSDNRNNTGAMEPSTLKSKMEEASPVSQN